MALDEQEIKQYATEMEQICCAYRLDQKTTQEFINCVVKLNDYISTLDNL